MWLNYCQTSGSFCNIYPWTIVDSNNLTSNCIQTHLQKLPKMKRKKWSNMAKWHSDRRKNRAYTSGSLGSTSWIMSCVYVALWRECWSMCSRWSEVGRQSQKSLGFATWGFRGNDGRRGCKDPRWAQWQGFPLRLSEDSLGHAWHTASSRFQHSVLENLASVCQRTNRRLGVPLYEASRRLEWGHVVCWNIHSPLEVGRRPDGWVAYFAGRCSVDLDRRSFAKRAMHGLPIYGIITPCVTIYNWYFELHLYSTIYPSMIYYNPWTRTLWPPSVLPKYPNSLLVNIVSVYCLLQCHIVWFPVSMVHTPRNKPCVGFFIGTIFTPHGKCQTC